jgi:cyclophilin family peptidyl-prolyl cis-trans isomerase
VLYHQISRDGFDSSRVWQQKFYVFDAPARKGTEVGMRSLVMRTGQNLPNIETNPSAIAALGPTKLMSFPEACKIVWQTNKNSDGYIARISSPRCRYYSDAFKQTIRPVLRYEVDRDSFALQDVLRNAKGQPLFPDAGLLRAARQPARTMAALLAESRLTDWRPLDPDFTLYLDLPSGRVIIELAPDFAPRAVINILRLVAAGYYDGLSINRVQDNFVAQWSAASDQRSAGGASATIAPEFTRSLDPAPPLTILPDSDGFAPQIGFSQGFAVGLNARTQQIWPLHCYGSLGVGRDNAADSGSGTELYVVIGHAPRQLDRNITLAGRVLRGMELLSALPRGLGAQG